MIPKIHRKELKHTKVVLNLVFGVFRDGQSPLVVPTCRVLIWIDAFELWKSSKGSL